MSHMFRKFKNGDFDLSDKPCSGRPPTISDTEIQELLDRDSTRTQLAEKLDVTQQAISERLHALGKIKKKKGKWVPHERYNVRDELTRVSRCFQDENISAFCYNS